MFDLRGKTLFCLEKHLAMHIMTIFSEHFGEMTPLALLATHLCEDLVSFSETAL